MNCEDQGFFNSFLNTRVALTNYTHSLINCSSSRCTLFVSPDGPRGLPGWRAEAPSSPSNIGDGLRIGPDFFGVRVSELKNQTGEVSRNEYPIFIRAFRCMKRVAFARRLISISEFCLKNMRVSGFFSPIWSSASLHPAQTADEHPHEVFSNNSLLPMLFLNFRFVEHSTSDGRLPIGRTAIQCCF